MVDHKVKLIIAKIIIGIFFGIVVVSMLGLIGFMAYVDPIFIATFLGILSVVILVVWAATYIDKNG